MSNKFGKFYYYRAVDKDGFDILTGTGDDCKILDWAATQERAIIECQRRHIADVEAENLELCTVIASDDTKITAEASTVLLFREALMKIARPEKWTNLPEQMLSDIRQIARKALKDSGGS